MTSIADGVIFQWIQTIGGVVFAAIMLAAAFSWRAIFKEQVE